MSSSRKNRNKNKSGTVKQVPLHVTDEQKRTIEAQLLERSKLLSEISNPISTGISIVIHVFLIQLSNQLALEDPQTYVNLENTFREIERLENDYNNRYGVTVDKSSDAVSFLDGYKSDANMRAYNSVFRDLIELIKSYAQCTRSPLTEGNVQSLQNHFNLTEIYNYLLDTRDLCDSEKSTTREAASAEKILRRRKNILMTILGVAFKFMVIDRLVSHLYTNYKQEENKIPTTFDEAKARIEELKIANKALLSLAERNRVSILTAAFVLAPMISYQAWSMEEFPSELTMFLVYGYITIFINILKIGNKMWKNYWLKTSFDERKDFLEKIMPTKAMYELTTQLENLLETSFITLKIKQFKEVNYTIVSQIIKNELLRHGINIADYKEDVIVIRGDANINDSLIAVIKNKIKDKLEEHNDAICFSQQISDIADILKDEQGGAVKETIIAHVDDFKKPYYSCYIKVPEYYLKKRYVNGEDIGPILDLDAIFTFAEVESLENGVYKISGSKYMDYNFRSSDDDEEEIGFRRFKKELIDATNAFTKRKKDIDFFKQQIGALSSRLNNVKLSYELEYGKEDALPLYNCTLLVPSEFSEIINENTLKDLFPKVEITNIDGGFILRGYSAAEEKDIDSTRKNIDNLKAKEDLKKEADVISNNNNNNNCNFLKRSKSDLRDEESVTVKVEKKPIIDFGNGVTYDPNIPEGCQFLQAASDPTKIDLKGFTKSAYILFNNAIYYFDIIDNTCNVLNLSDSIIKEVKTSLGLQEDPSLNEGIKVLITSLTRKHLNRIYKITNHEHHEQEVAPFEEASDSLVKGIFFFRRLSSVMTEEHFVNSGFDRSVSKKAFHKFNKMTKEPAKSNGRFGGQGVIFQTDLVTDINGNQVISEVKLKPLRFFGDARLYAVSSQSVAPDKRRVLYTPVSVNPHAHS